MPRLVIAVLVLLVTAGAAMAEKPVSPEQLAGKWTYAQTVYNDVYVDGVGLEMGGRRPGRDHDLHGRGRAEAGPVQPTS